MKITHFFLASFVAATVRADFENTWAFYVKVQGELKPLQIGPEISSETPMIWSDTFVGASEFYYETGLAASIDESNPGFILSDTRVGIQFSIDIPGSIMVLEEDSNRLLNSFYYSCDIDGIHTIKSRRINDMCFLVELYFMKYDREIDRPVDQYEVIDIVRQPHVFYVTGKEELEPLYVGTPSPFDHTSFFRFFHGNSTYVPLEFITQGDYAFADRGTTSSGYAAFAGNAFVIAEYYGITELHLSQHHHVSARRFFSCRFSGFEMNEIVLNPYPCSEWREVDLYLLPTGNKTGEPKEGSFMPHDIDLAPHALFIKENGDWVPVSFPVQGYPRKAFISKNPEAKPIAFSFKHDIIFSADLKQFVALNNANLVIDHGIDQIPFGVDDEMKIRDHTFFIENDRTITVDSPIDPESTEVDIYLLPLNIKTGKPLDPSNMPEDEDGETEDSSSSFSVLTMATSSESSVATFSETPETSVNTISDIPVTSVDTTHTIPETSVNTMSNIPETSVNTMSDIPETFVNTKPESPETSVNTTLEIPETSGMTMSGIPETSVDKKLNIPETSVTTMSDIPETSVNTMSDISETSVNTMSESPETSVDKKLNIPETSVDKKLDIPETSVDKKLDIPETSVDKKLDIPETSVDTMGGASSSSNSTQASTSSTSISDVTEESADNDSKHMVTTLTKEITSTATRCIECKAAPRITVRKTYTDYTTYCPNKTTVAVTVCQEVCQPSTVTVTTATTLTFPGVCIVPETIAVGDSGPGGAAETAKAGYYGPQGTNKSPSVLKNPAGAAKAGTSDRKGGDKIIAADGFVPEGPAGSPSAPKSPNRIAKVDDFSPKPSNSRKSSNRSKSPKLKSGNLEETTPNTLTGPITAPGVFSSFNGASKNAIGAYVLGLAALLL